MVLPVPVVAVGAPLVQGDAVAVVPGGSGPGTCGGWCAVRVRCRQGACAGLKTDPTPPIAPRWRPGGDTYPTPPDFFKLEIELPPPIGLALRIWHYSAIGIPARISTSRFGIDMGKGAVKHSLPTAYLGPIPDLTKGVTFRMLPLGRSSDMRSAHCRSGEGSDFKSGPSTFPMAWGERIAHPWEARQVSRLDPGRKRR